MDGVLSKWSGYAIHFDENCITVTRNNRQHIAGDCCAIHGGGRVKVFRLILGWEAEKSCWLHFQTTMRNRLHIDPRIRHEFLRFCGNFVIHLNHDDYKGAFSKYFWPRIILFANRREHFIVAYGLFHFGIIEEF